MSWSFNDKIYNISLDNGLAPNRQTIMWIIADVVHTSK